MKAVIGLVASLVWFSAGAEATTKVSVVGVTSTQAIVRVTTDQVGNCTYQLSERPDLSILVNDVNPALFSGANSDARVTTVIAGNERFFVAGQRRGDQAGDGRFYSRALAANTPHYGAVTCGTDAAAAFTFTTHTIAVGTTYTDPQPFDSRGLGNYAIPAIDYTNPSNSYVDPQTGFRFNLITGPGQMLESTNILYGASGSGNSNGNVNAEASGNNWTNPSQALVTDASFASYTASAQDPLFLRMASSCPQGTCFSAGWQNVNGSGVGGITANIDAIQVALTGNGAGSTQSIDIALSCNGVTQCTDWYSQTLPASTGTITYPSSLTPGFTAWQDSNFPLIPAVGVQLLEQHATVNVSGSIVTRTNGAFFALDSRVLTAGSKITISGAEYTIASVDSAFQVTLTSTPPSGNGVTAYWFNLSVMVRKHSASAGTLNIDGLTLTLAFSESFGNGGAGFQNQCSHLTSTDGSGNVGRFCLFESHWGHTGVYWVMNNGQSRFISRGSALPSSIGVPADEYGYTAYGGQSLFDLSDPNSWWSTATLSASGKVTLIKLTYHPSDGGACTNSAGYSGIPDNYQAITPAMNWDLGSIDNCHITVTEVTRPSLGKDLYTQINAINPIPVSTKYPAGPLFSFMQGGVAVLTVTTQQDAEAWVVTVDTSTGLVKGVISTYMNTAKAGCRGCVLHASVPSGPTDTWYNLAYNGYRGGSNTGQGFYNLAMTTALQISPSISVASCGSLVTDSSVSWLLPYSDGCDVVTYSGTDGIPCDPDPSSWESSNMPNCSWHSGWTQWAAGAVQIGDWFQDPVTGYETMVVGATNTSSHTLTLIRNTNPPKGPGMTQQPGISGAYARCHPSDCSTPSWTATIQCNMPGSAMVSTTETNGNGLLWDRKIWTSGHLVIRAGGISSGEIFAFATGPSGESVRTGALPGTINHPETNAVLNGAAFSGVHGIGGSGSFVQEHPGWDGIGPITDMAPFAPSLGGSFNLWPNTGITNVTGSLYKIPAGTTNCSSNGTACNTGSALNPRLLGTAVWSGMWNFKDISGSGSITGASGDNYHYCVIAYSGATCGQSGAGEAVGDIFLNIPQASPSVNAGQTFDVNSPSVTALGQEPMAALQYFYYHTGPYPTENLGRWERRVTTGLGRYDGQDTYSNSKVIFNSNLLVFNCATPNLQRIGDLCVGQAPPESQDSATRNDFVRYPVAIPAGGATYAEVQFGYGENGSSAQFYCTSRQEACNTSSPAGTAFNWEGEARTLTNCASGCTIRVPSLPGHVLFYSIRRSTDGVNWTNGALQVATIN